MQRSFLRGLLLAESDRLLQKLSQWQHLGPHESVDAVLKRTVEQLGVCPAAVDQVVGRLQIDTSQPVGRLRRTELVQLARTLHRQWRAGQPRQPAGSAS